MCLRSLYGSRMPQALHPRVDPQGSSYWEEDTVSSQEIARVMEEEGHSGINHFEIRKKNGNVLMATALGSEKNSRRSSVETLPSEMEFPDGMALTDVESLRMEDMGSSPINAQLSPAGLISIVAADVDEVATNSLQNVLPVNGELDLAFIRSLRRAPRVSHTKSYSCNPFKYVTAFLSTLLAAQCDD
ncbi:hypothetical protein PsorP6_008584 [Peronosclerospora sorghi]|uniref:Uncharacterized protein n=1 Tax=Peronosclerospora sorghi TaxID=230839 RepID=A0ACC0WCF4_9STRA|nr:hypothetical protein PsorP6_008584 [Peronosclerospora sorghi]